MRVSGGCFCFPLLFVCETNPRQRRNARAATAERRSGHHRRATLSTQLDVPVPTDANVVAQAYDIGHH